MKKSNKSFNIALKEILESKKIKLRSLASKTNLNYTYFSKLKNRKKHPPIETIKIIAEGLNIDPEYFLEFRIYKIVERLLNEPDLIEPVLEYLKQLEEKKHLKVAEEESGFKKNLNK